MALNIPHSIFYLARLLYVRPETFGPSYVYISIRSSSLLVGYSSTNPSISSFIDPANQLTNTSVLGTYISIFIYILTELCFNQKIN
jgi:hypothetical protein